MDTLTDESLGREVAADYRTIGRLAWHIVTSIHEMLTRTGLEFASPGDEHRVPESAAAIAEAYRRTSSAMLEAVRSQWTDADLARTCDMYGEQWANGFTLQVLVDHEIHHRAQMTVLMRLAGLRVPGLYGPAREDWAGMGMQPPVV
jgi:uncharacterized damage-inducible protein DinB